MAMPDDIADDLDLLRRVFPKWQCDNILSYLTKSPRENRVKHALCKYISSHDLRLNRTDCESDAKLVHKIFPEVPFEDIFRKMTIFGDERNRVRICLRLLLSEGGFQSNSSSDFEIDSQEINALLKKHPTDIADLNGTLTSLHNIRNKYRQKKSRWSPPISDNASGPIDKVVLSESPDPEVTDSGPSTSTAEDLTNSISEGSDIEKNNTDSPEISSSSRAKSSVDLLQLENFFNNSELDFSQEISPIEVDQIKNIQVDKIDVRKSVIRNGVVLTNPFDDSNSMLKSNKKDLIDLTGKTRKRSGKPYSYTHHTNEIINLDTQELHSEVIIEDKRIPEPIVVKLKKQKVSAVVQQPQTIFVDDSLEENSQQTVEEEPQAIAGPSGMQTVPKRKTDFFLSPIERNVATKKSKMNEPLIDLDPPVDNALGEKRRLIDSLFEDSEELIKDDTPPSPPPRAARKSILMYDDLLDKKKATLSQTFNSQDLSEGAEETPLIEEEEDNSKLVVDEALYFPLLEIFPEACPGFLKKLCNGKVNNPGELDRLISEVLDRADYPKRTKSDEDTNQPEISVEDQLEILIQVLPDADPMYLKKQIEACDGNSEAIKQFINDAMENKSYPTLKEYQRKQQLSTQSKQYTTEFNVEKYLEQIPDPETYFKDNKNIKTFEEFGFDERDYLQVVLKSVFNMLPIRIINSKMKASRTVSLIFDDLYDAASKSSNHMKCRRKIVPGNTVLQNIPFLQEVAYNVNRAAVISYQASLTKLLEERREQHRIAATLETCCCCYDDALLPEEVVQCETGCDSCKVCVQKSTEVAFGEGKTEFPCVGGCGKDYNLRILQEALSKKLFSKVAQKRQLAEVRAAGLEDLEQCPFCDFANIPTAEDRLFRCFNPECMKESCRKCKEPNHIPLRCEEVEKDADVQARTAIENRMTEALVRSCWQCQTKFIKSEGCNKMTCPKCKAHSCYVCGVAVKDYTHFNGQGGDKYNLCPLYSDTNKLHEEAVLKAAQEAKKDVDPNALKHDPTADLQNHFVEYNKKNPIYLPPGVHINDPNNPNDINRQILQAAQDVYGVLRNAARDLQVPLPVQHRAVQQHQHHQQRQPLPMGPALPPAPLPMGPALPPAPLRMAPAVPPAPLNRHFHRPVRHGPAWGGNNRHHNYAPPNIWGGDANHPRPHPQQRQHQNNNNTYNPVVWDNGRGQGGHRGGGQNAPAPAPQNVRPANQLNQGDLREAMGRALQQYGDARPHRRDNR